VYPRTLVLAVLIAGVPSARSDDPKPETITGKGFVVAAKRGTITSTVPGRVHQIMVREGEQVKQSQVLFRLDPTMQELNVKRAEIQLKIAKAKYDQLRAGAGEERRKVARAVVVNAEAGLKAAQVDLERLKKLRAAGAVSEEDYSRGAASVQSAQAELDGRRAELNALEKGAPKEELVAAELAVEAAQVELKRAEAALAATVIYAPFEGIVYRLGVEPGSYTNPAMTGIANAAALCEIVDTSAPRIEATFPEGIFFRLKVGGECAVKVASLADKTFQGTIERISPVIEGGLVTVRVKLGGDGAVPLGASARVELLMK
jgi:multidrug resistance efflux pump